MDWKTFIASIIESLSWPLAIIGTAFFARKKISSILLNLTKAKYGDIELEFSKKSDALEAEAKKIVQRSKEDPFIKTELNRLSELAIISPRAAVFESWRILESVAAQRLSQTTELKEKEEKKIFLHTKEAVFSTLLQDNEISKSEYEMIQELKKLRNIAVHSSDVEFESVDVGGYINTAVSLASILEHKAKQNK